MKTENILKFMAAGFTAEELKKLDEYSLDDIQNLIDGKMTTEQIMGSLEVLDKVNKAPSSQTNENPPTEGGQDDPAHIAEPNKESDAIKLLTDELKALKATIQASNINAGSNSGSKPITLEDIGNSFFGNEIEGGQNNGK